MPVFTDALIGDTTHLSAEEFGAYCLILFATWRNNGKPLADDDVSLARVTRARGCNHWATKLKPRLKGFFDISDGYWRQKRLEKEWLYVSKRREKQSAAGKRSAQVRASKTTNSPQPPLQRSVNEAVNTHTLKEESLTSPIEHSRKDTNLVGRAQRATRWKGDVPTPWVVEAPAIRLEAHLPEIDASNEARKFADHWIAQSGQRGTKRDWHATWRNWIRNAKANVKGNGHAGPITQLFRGFAAAVGENDGDPDRPPDGPLLDWERK